MSKNKDAVKVVNCTPNGYNAFKSCFVGEEISHLLGEVLTIIDASTEGDKNKAIKNLIKNVFNKKQEWISSLAWKELEEEKDGHSPKMDWEYGLVPFVDKTYSFK